MIKTSRARPRNRRRSTGAQSREELSLDDLYRPLRRADCGEIARHYNRNLAELEPIWCAGGSEYDANRVWLHRLVLMARGRGRLIDQVHERRGRVISYFGGYARGDRVTFSIGVVDPDLPDPLATWRRDAVHLFAAALRTGAGDFRIRASSDRAWFVEWMEREVGMERLAGRNVWVAGRAAIVSHVDAQSRPPEPAGTPRPSSAGAPTASGRWTGDRVGREAHSEPAFLVAPMGSSRPRDRAAMDAPAWATVSAERPCPCCGGTGGCGTADETHFVHCRLLVSSRPIEGGGWLHVLARGGCAP